MVIIFAEPYSRARKYFAAINVIFSNGFGFSNYVLKPKNIAQYTFDGLVKLTPAHVKVFSITMRLIFAKRLWVL
jgi:hypothetical protein